MNSKHKALQDQFAPQSICFGCGPANPRGLQIKSRILTEGANHPGETELEFDPEPYQQAFPGMLNGGIIGTLLDCHSNWTAAAALMTQSGAAEPPCTVTADFHVKLRAPTPSTQRIRVRAWPMELKHDRAQIHAELLTVDSTGAEKLTATCRGTFVAVKPGHPAYHRWG